jgi:hypothetical protein
MLHLCEVAGRVRARNRNLNQSASQKGFVTTFAFGSCAFLTVPRHTLRHSLPDMQVVGI